jgi:hypothetical protein
MTGNLIQLKDTLSIERIQAEEHYSLTHFPWELIFLTIKSVIKIGPILTHFLPPGKL